MGRMYPQVVLSADPLSVEHIMCILHSLLLPVLTYAPAISAAADESVQLRQGEVGGNLRDVSLSRSIGTGQQRQQQQQDTEGGGERRHLAAD